MQCFILKTELMEEAQKGKDRKEVDFSNYCAVCTGSATSDSHTTPRTLDSIFPSSSHASSASRPDSGLPPSVPPHCESSSSQCSEPHPLSARDVKKRTLNPIRSEASNFDTPRVLGRQEQPVRAPYPVYQSRIRSKSKGSTREFVGDKEPEGGSGHHKLLGCGTIMVSSKHLSPSNYSDMEEEDEESDIEKDGTFTAGWSQLDCTDSDSDEANQHRILPQQVIAALDAAASTGNHHRTSEVNTSFSSSRTRGDACGVDTRQIPTSPSPSQSSSQSSSVESQSSLPIDIPSKHLQSPILSINAHIRKSRADSTESDTISQPNTLPLHLSAADVPSASSGTAISSPKVLQHHPTLWERVKNGARSYLTSTSDGGASGCHQQGVFDFRKL